MLQGPVTSKLQEVAETRKELCVLASKSYLTLKALHAPLSWLTIPSHTFRSRVHTRVPVNGPLVIATPTPDVAMLGNDVGQGAVVALSLAILLRATRS